MSQDMEILQTYKGDKGFFIKSFLFDDTFNKNGWRISAEAIKRDTKTFIQKEFFGKTAPFIIREDRKHPMPEGHESMIEMQEPARVGDFIDFGFEEKNFSDGATIKAFQISQIFDKDAQDKIRSKEVQFISPSIRANDETIDNEGRITINAFIGSHNAGVDEPAYGMQKAQIKGICEGDHGTCMTNLKNVQASTKSKSTIELHACGMVTVNFSGQDVSDCLSKKLQKGEKPTKQDLAICFEEERSGGLDPISLENITRPELLLKKKDALGNKNTNTSNLKGKTLPKKMIPMTNKQAREVEPLDDGTCPEGFVMGENGKCLLTAAAYIAQEEEEKKNDNESATDDLGPDKKPKIEDATEDDMKTLKEEQGKLQARFDDEIKKPLVASIIGNKGKLGLIKSADVLKENKSLMGRQITDLESLDSDYVAMLQNAGQQVEEHTDKARFILQPESFSGSADDGSEKQYDFLKDIRSKMN